MRTVSVVPPSGCLCLRSWPPRGQPIESPVEIGGQSFVRRASGPRVCPHHQKATRYQPVAAIRGNMSQPATHTVTGHGPTHALADDKADPRWFGHVRTAHEIADEQGPADAPALLDSLAELRAVS